MSVCSNVQVPKSVYFKLLFAYFFYFRSPYFSHKSTKSTPDHEDADGQISPFSFLSEDDVLATPSSFYTDNFDSSSDDLLLDTPETNMNTEVFPSVGDRILLFQSGKHTIHQMQQVHQVHQVPSKYSRMSTSPTVSPVLGMMNLTDFF